MGALSDYQIGVGSSVKKIAELTATVTNSLKGGDLAYVSQDSVLPGPSPTPVPSGYWAFVPWATDANTGVVAPTINVIFADVGSTTSPGRWMRLNIVGAPTAIPVEP